MVSYTFKSEEELDLVREKYFTHKFKHGYRIFNGYTMPEYFSEVQSVIENLEVFEDDIWVTSYPKTGTTWTREMVWCITNNLDFEGATEPLPYRFPFLEFSIIFDFRNYAKDNPFEPFPAINQSIELVKTAKRPRFIKTHLPWELLPRQIRNFEKRPKIIHVARNPKDTCVSYFHHCKIIEGYTGNFEDFWQLFISNRLNWTPYWDNVLSYWTRQSEANLLFIKYEDMKYDLENVIKTVSSFLNKNIDTEQMAALLNHLSFEEMKKTKASNFEPVVEFLKQFNLCQNETGHFMRAGLIGNYRAQMCADVIEIFDKWTEEHIKDTGLTFIINK